MELNDLRRKIDEVDFKILKLFNERMELAIQTKKLKPGIEDPLREKEILQKVARLRTELLSPNFLNAVYVHVIEESRRRQGENRLLVGFQGEHGAFSEAAARKYLPDQVYIPFAEFEEIFLSVEQGILDFGIVPVENSLGGAVTQVNDLLIKTPLSVAGEVNIQIRHCLLTLHGSDHKEIKAVYSHPQALAQCKSFILRNKLEGRPYYDTAGAAKMLAIERPRAAAAIASELCAGLYHLEVIKAGIEDNPRNLTRFLILGKEPAKEGNKCSLVFSAPHKVGALFHVLKIFTEAGINLTRIESVPIVGKDIHYAFFTDFQGSDREPVVKETLERVKQQSLTYKFLGCYTEEKIQ
ncbi:MAG: bifunctional chorismate mutase/prephenate dehydratase [Candidatus Aminicenantales bacterium]